MNRMMLRNAAPLWAVVASVLALSAAAADPYPTNWTEDWDGDGTVDHVYTDTDGDGNPDRCSVDKDNDGDFDEVWRDDNDDGVWDKKLYDFDSGGFPRRWKADTNGDGVFDEAWHDKNQDGGHSASEKTTIAEPVPTGPKPKILPDDRMSCDGLPDCLDDGPMGLEGALTWSEDWTFELIPDHYYSDADLDANPEWGVVDMDQNGLFEESYVDRDDDGTWDERWNDTDFDGRYDTYAKDTDGDAFYDELWLDGNFDGKMQVIEISTIEPPEPVTPEHRPMAPLSDICTPACPPFPLYPAEPLDFVHLDRGSLALTVTSQGIIGFMDETQTDGKGLRYPSETSTKNHLYVGSIWVAQGETYVANRDFDTDPKKEFVVAPAPEDGHIELEFLEGPDTKAEGGIVDDASADPFGFYIRQESWAFDSGSDEDDFIIVRYFIHNRSGSAQDDLRAGLFLDLDLEETQMDDEGATDGDRNMAYLNDPTGTHIGVKILEGDATPPVDNLTLIPNPTYIWPQSFVLDEDKFGFLSGSDPLHSQSSSSGPDDYSLLVSVGPFSLEPGDSTEVPFAIVGATSLFDLRQSAARAQAYYNPSVDVVDGSDGAPQPIKLLANMPNPFATRTAVRFELSQAARISLDVFDVTGRRVRALASGVHPAGAHALTWDGRNDAGRPMGSGIYFLKLTRDNGTESRRMTLLR